MELIIILLICAVLIVTQMIPAILLWNYANQIGYFLKAPDPASFAAAITAQKSFWKYLGIVLIPAGLLGMLIAAADLLRVVSSG
jgi:hypothetical protein